MESKKKGIMKSSLLKTSLSLDQAEEAKWQINNQENLLAASLRVGLYRAPMQRLKKGM